MPRQTFARLRCVIRAPGLDHIQRAIEALRELDDISSWRPEVDEAIKELSLAIRNLEVLPEHERRA